MTATLALALYVAMWVGYRSGWPLVTSVDTWALREMHRIGETRPGWVTAWDVFCTVFGPGAFRIVTVAVIIGALIRRNLTVAMFLLISVQLSGLITEIAKYLAGRPRPDTAFVAAHSTSFPSGHAVGVMVSVCALLTIALPAVRRMRGVLIAAGALLVVAIGVGRVVLNVHHPSDVLAGWALGYAYFLLCVRLVPPRRPVTEADEKRPVPGTSR